MVLKKHELRESVQELLPPIENFKIIHVKGNADKFNANIDLCLNSLAEIENFVRM